MPRPLVLATAAAAVGLVLVLLAPRPSFAEGRGSWVKFLFTPQAGYNSACLSCGWHDVCTDDWNPGPALDFPASCSGGQSVYFRNFGFLWPQTSTAYVGYAAAYEVDYTLCKTVKVPIWDTGGTVLGEMWYVHTYLTYPGIIWLYANGNGYENEQVVALMADWGNHPENQRCIELGWWTGPHLHEQHENYASTFFLRDDGDCESGDRYPCGPQPPPYPTYYPQDWENDWVRGFCIDDTDCDGWTDDQESVIGTDPEDDCPDDRNDDAWPPDFDMNAWVNILDVVHFRGKFPPAPYDPRYDLKTDGVINILDVVKMRPVMHMHCAP
jgi:hypothetical protein